MYPATLAVAQEVGASGEEFIAACVVGYEVGCRVGEYLGKSHYEVCITCTRANVLSLAYLAFYSASTVPQLVELSALPLQQHIC